MTDIIALSISILVSLGLAIFLAALFWILVRNIDAQDSSDQSMINAIYKSIKRSLMQAAQFIRT